MKRLNLACAAALLSFISTGSSATDLKLLSTWDKSYSAVPLIAHAFLDGVRDASGGKVKSVTMGPEVVPAFEQVQPVSTGVFDLLFTHGQLHVGDTGIGSALDAIDGDPVKRKQLGIWDAVDQHYQKKLNLKLIALPTALTGYQLVLKRPMDNGTIDGRKIRGTVGYHGLIKAVGGTPVVMAPGDIYTAAQSGVVDGTAWPVVGAFGLRFCEVMPVSVRPAFGVVTFMILMNKDKFNALPKDEQALLLDQGEKIEKRTIEQFQKIADDEDKQIAEKCKGKIDQQSAEWAKKANVAYADGAWAIAIQSSKGEAETFRAFVKKQGMTD